MQYSGHSIPASERCMCRLCSCLIDKTMPASCLQCRANHWSSLYSYMEMSRLNEFGQHYYKWPHSLFCTLSFAQSSTSVALAILDSTLISVATIMHSHHGLYTVHSQPLTDLYIAKCYLYVNNKDEAKKWLESSVSLVSSIAELGEAHAWVSQY